MNLIALLAAILFGTLSPIPLEGREGIKEGYVAAFEDQVLVAVLPEAVASYDKKCEILRDAADELAAACGKEVVLTQDLLTYLCLSRIERRGVNEYERKNLASCVAAQGGACIVALP